MEQEGEVLHVRCHAGFGAEGLTTDTIPTDRSFAALVLSRGRTAYVEDLNQRPDLIIPVPKTGPPFKAVLASPKRPGVLWNSFSVDDFRVIGSVRGPG